MGRKSAYAYVYTSFIKPENTDTDYPLPQIQNILDGVGYCRKQRGTLLFNRCESFARSLQYKRFRGEMGSFQVEIKHDLLTCTLLMTP